MEQITIKSKVMSIASTKILPSWRRQDVAAIRFRPFATTTMASAHYLLAGFASLKPGLRAVASLFASCVYPVADVPAEKGFEIFISSPMAVQARKSLPSNFCSRITLKIAKPASRMVSANLHVANITGAESGKYMGEITRTTVDMVAPGIIRDTSKCILCGPTN